MLGAAENGDDELPVELDNDGELAVGAFEGGEVGLAVVEGLCADGLCGVAVSEGDCGEAPCSSRASRSTQPSSLVPGGTTCGCGGHG